MSVVSQDAAAPVRSMSAVPRSVWIGGGMLCAVTAGLASALVLRTPEPPAPVSAAAAPAAVVATAATPLAGISAKPSAAPAAPKAARPAKPATHATQATTVAEGPTHLRGGTTPAALCAACGTVEAVSTIQEKGEGTGMGAVAGGVLGGVVGNQVGGGNGKTAMTVIGALGGGLAGHEVEKRVRSETRYDIRVRMEDGSTRVFRQAQSMAIGTRVIADGTSLRLARDAVSTPEPQMVRTSSTAGGRT
jgi:outer membrane lipoprotein SlyB